MWSVGKDLSQASRTPETPAKWEQASVFEALAMPLFDSLYNFASWLAANREDTEDLVQETYLKALRSFRSFEPGTNFKAWMFTILRNSFYSKCSKVERKITVTFDSEDELPPLEFAANPESLLVDRMAAERLWRAIERLPLGFREVFLLRETEDASYNEIAEILSIPVGTVMSRLARARTNIRASLRQSTERRPLKTLLRSPQSVTREASLNEA